jgi:hypothetical protein
MDRSLASTADVESLTRRSTIGALGWRRAKASSTSSAALPLDRYVLSRPDAPTRYEIRLSRLQPISSSR